jgi:hypothetical protein
MSSSMAENSSCLGITRDPGAATAKEATVSAGSGGDSLVWTRFTRPAAKTGRIIPPRAITYSVFRLAARRTDRSVRDSVSGIRAGERKTCCAKPLPRPPGLWGLNAVPPFADAHSGRSAGQLAGFGCTKRAFERPTKLGFGCSAPVQRRRWPSRRKRRHPTLACTSPSPCRKADPGS